jgi:hypothetical protein
LPSNTGRARTSRRRRTGCLPSGTDAKNLEQRAWNVKPFFHPATDRDLARFREFEGSLEYVDERLSDRSDVIFNWTIVGVEPCAGGKRVLLNECSSCALAWVVGDGERFGQVVAVDADDVEDILRRFGITQR